MKRLLVISYYFPPMGMSGVQRTLKFVKYLPEFGWKSEVLTVQPRGSYGYDSSLLDEIPSAHIHRTFSLDPLYLSPSGHRPTVAVRKGILEKVNGLIVPDNKLGWIPFAITRGIALAKAKGIDAIYSTAPPYSSHLAAVILKNTLRKPLISDFRDAWVDYTWTRHPTRAHYQADHYLESLVLRKSDAIIAVNPGIINSLKKLHPDIPARKLYLIPHGYDHQDFSHKVQTSSNKFRITHIGTFINNRTPRPLLEALKILGSTRPQLLEKIQITFVGTYSLTDVAMVKGSGLANMINFTGYLSHQKSIDFLINSDLLWMVMGPEETANVTPGKLFEYIGSRKPILASIPTDGAAANLLAETSSGIAIPPNDFSALATQLAFHINAWQSKMNIYRGDKIKIEQYDRQNITGKLSRLLNDLI
jgi:glycosyltransferase involved in cell wall biosynthesis